AEAVRSLRDSARKATASAPWACGH
ncbi:ribulose-phosphate 3-epimerase, partial [Streptomyces albidoflavus]